MKPTKRRVVRWLTVLVLAIAALGLGTWAALRVPGVYLRFALAVIQHEAYYRERVDWPRVRTEALGRARNARSTRDTYPAIQHALRSLGDRHSHLRPPMTAPAQRAQSMVNQPPSARELDAQMGYVELPGHGGDGRLHDGRQYATVAHLEIARLDSRSPRCGWIVDLRRNSGGNMWPMLAAIGPILGEGEVGSFVSRGSPSRWSWANRWSYARGAALLGRRVQAKVHDPYAVARPLAPVAVLIGPRTASSGEAVAVAFQGRPRARFFGQPTAGVPTANQPYPLPDGARLMLMVAVDADRKGRTYDGPIPPDTQVLLEPSGVGHTTDPAIDVAAEWLRGQPGCAAVAAVVPRR